MRAVFYHTDILNQKGCCHHRQYRIFRALYLCFSKKSISSQNMNSIQILTICLPVSKFDLFYYM